MLWEISTVLPYRLPILHRFPTYSCVTVCPHRPAIRICFPRGPYRPLLPFISGENRFDREHTVGCTFAEAGWHLAISAAACP